MALHQDDLMVVQKHDGANEIRKATIQQLSDYLQATDSVAYKGLKNFTVNDVGGAGEPTTKNIGDLYINNALVTGTWAWSANSGSVTTVEPGDRAIWNGSQWDVITSGSGDVGVTEVTGSLPIQIEDGDTDSPNVKIRAASTTESGSVARLAEAADVAKDGTGDSAAVVTADLLKATNIALDAASAGGVTTVLGEDPIVISTDGTNSSTTTQPSIAIKDASSSQKGAIATQEIGSAVATGVDVAATPGYVDAYYLIKDFSSLGDA